MKRAKRYALPPTRTARRISPWGDSRRGKTGQGRRPATGGAMPPTARASKRQRRRRTSPIERPLRQPGMRVHCIPTPPSSSQSVRLPRKGPIDLSSRLPCNLTRTVPANQPDDAAAANVSSRAHHHPKNPRNRRHAARRDNRFLTQHPDVSPHRPTDPSLGLAPDERIIRASDFLGGGELNALTNPQPAVLHSHYATSGEAKEYVRLEIQPTVATSTAISTCLLSQDRHACGIATATAAPDPLHTGTTALAGTTFGTITPTSSTAHPPVPTGTETIPP